MKAFIYIPGDPSVGIPNVTLEMELPFVSMEDLSKDELEELRNDIKNLYSKWNDDAKVRVMLEPEYEEMLRQDQFGD